MAKKKWCYLRMSSTFRVWSIRTSLYASHQSATGWHASSVYRRWHAVGPPAGSSRQCWHWRTARGPLVARKVAATRRPLVFPSAARQQASSSWCVGITWPKYVILRSEKNIHIKIRNNRYIQNKRSERNNLYLIYNNNIRGENKWT